MKTLLTTLGIIALASIGTTPKAAAREHGSTINVSEFRCGVPIYRERYFVGYDRCGNPVWATRIMRVNYRPVPPPPPRDEEPYRESVCPPRDERCHDFRPRDAAPYREPVRYPEPPCDRGRVVIQGYFGR